MERAFAIGLTTVTSLNTHNHSVSQRPPHAPLQGHDVPKVDCQHHSIRI